MEDWGTGYWRSWPGGKHYKGENYLPVMVGFVKELVHEVGAADITFPERGLTPRRTPEIEEIRVAPSIVAARKARPDS